jgi:hypothetical protein
VQVLDQLRLVLRLGTFDVGVLDAEKEGAAPAPGEKPVVEGGPSIPHVQQPRWRRSEAYTDLLVGHGGNDDRRRFGANAVDPFPAKG